MKLFDSLSKEKRILDQNEVKIYACGPTVYNLIHIGNARPLIVTDVIVRYLKATKANVNFLMNITDIDDKIISAALAQNISDIDLAEKYANHFKKNMADLNVLMPNKLIPISTKMNDIVDFISELVAAEDAYVVDGDVYFDIEKYIKDYGKVSHQKTDEVMNGVRIENETNKKSPLDFVLWKKTNAGRQFMTPWSNGRPGWHTECVTLIDRYFKDTVSLHIGGTDLRFPHHENERIQYLAKTKKELAKIWFHVGHIMLENQKMSKSIGNIITVDDFLKTNSTNDLRYIMLSSKYSQPVNVTDNLIQQAGKWNAKIENLLRKINWMHAIDELKISTNVPMNDEFEELDFKNVALRELDDDLNTAQVITIIDQIIKYLNGKIKIGSVDQALAMLQDILPIMGFTYNIVELSDKDISDIKQWRKLIADSDFATADELRKELEAKKII